MKKFWYILSLISLVSCYPDDIVEEANQELFFTTSVGGLCTPTSCKIEGKDCGAISDGCGKIIICGLGKCKNSHEGCGVGQALPNCSNAPGEPNVCGGGCVEVNDINHTSLCNEVGGTPWWCAVYTSVPPNPSCIPYDNTSPEHVWCCP